MKGEIAVKPNATVQCINMQHLDSLSQVHLCGDPLTGQSINPPPPSLHTVQMPKLHLALAWVGFFRVC